MFFTAAPFMATYSSSKHALQVCAQDQNAVRHFLRHMANLCNIIIFLVYFMSN